MSWKSLKICVDRALADPLSDALFELGALSVSLEDADAGTAEEQAIFAEPGEPETSVWQRCFVIALLDANADAGNVLEQAADRTGSAPLAAELSLVADTDWVRLTQSQFEPIRISNRLWIVPSWHAAPAADAINLRLDPGLAFGTGSHPTTRLCLRWLEAHLQGGERVLDYGCGSGILAIAAAKLGAGQVEGVDIDPQAVLSAQQNAERNGVAAKFCLPRALEITAPVDILVANILSNPLRILAPALAAATRSAGRIALSGILLEQADEIADGYRPWFEIDTWREEDGWVCLSGIRR